MVDATADSLAGNRLPLRPPPGRYVFVEVVDTGCGMDEATLSRIFDPFYTTKFTGRGLGMPAVHGIVTHHGGALFIDTAVGRGTTVRALFPAAQAQGAPSKAAGPARAPAASARRAILVVDDEPLVASALKRMLKRLGFEAHVGLGGAEGLALCGQHAPSLAGAIVDLTMPDMSGTTVAAELQVLCPGLPVILSSGFDVDPVEAAPASSGIVGFLPKPYSLEALARVLERCVHVPA